MRRSNMYKLDDLLKQTGVNHPMPMIDGVNMIYAKRTSVVQVGIVFEVVEMMDCGSFSRVSCLCTCGLLGIKRWQGSREGVCFSWAGQVIMNSMGAFLGESSSESSRAWVSSLALLLPSNSCQILAMGPSWFGHYHQAPQKCHSSFLNDTKQHYLLITILFIINYWYISIF